MRRGAKPAKAKVEAKPLASKSRKSDDSKIRDLEKRLAESLEREKATSRELNESLAQQAATGEILDAISRSLTDLQPIIEAVAQNASRLSGAANVSLYRVEGDQMRKVAEQGRPLTAIQVGETRPITRTTVSGRAIVDRTTIHLRDHQSAEAVREYPDSRRDTGIRTTIGIPLLREGIAIGVFTAYRTESRPFTEREIALLQTFANQAVIAIENARLFNETKEALGRQTATSEILRAIAGSPTEIQPVLDTIAENAARVCGANDAVIYRIEQGDVTRIVAGYGPIPKRRVGEPGRNLVRESIAGRAMLERQTVHVHDIQSDEGDEFPFSRELQRQIPNQPRTILSTPLLREGVSIGALLIRRAEVQPFTDRQIELLQTFADQAVIAIENVRLFKELQTSNRELTTALDKQTATSEILRVISQSQTDVQPVFDAIVASAVRLLGGHTGALTRIVDDQIDIVALTRTDDAGDAARRAAFPQSLHSESVPAQAIRERMPVNIADAHTDPRLPETEHGRARARGYRSWIVVPMLRHNKAIGTIAVTRRQPGGFNAEEIALLQTFADQAVIAIENARLFKELQERTAELTRSVEKLTALGEVSQAVSSTLDLETVLDTITERARQLAGADGGAIYEYDEGTQQFHLRATRNADAALIQALRATPLRKGEGVMGRATETREPIQIGDIAAPGVYESHIRDVLIRAGYRALLSVPIVREGQIIGSLSLNRKAPGDFSVEVIDVLKTFATQSALAIQNARLFREIEVKSRELAAASQHKSEFLANMSHELRTPLNAIIGFSEVLSERMFGELNEKQEEYSKDIHASGQHLLSLINDILDLSKIEAGRMELELSDFHLPTALDSALSLVRERAGRRSIALHLSVDERLGQIQADERKVRQVVLNLLSNAIKFTPEGGRIEVMAAPKNGVVEVSVSDTGVGIAQEDQEAVFEEFRQVGTADKKVEGTGLGLTLCRKFVELHGGKIWVRSQLGAGSTFTFTIPTGT